MGQWNSRNQPKTTTAVAELKRLIDDRNLTIKEAEKFRLVPSEEGSNENSDECLETVHNLLERIEPYGATLVLIHHSSRGNSEKRTSMASRGTGALPAAASQLIQLEHFYKNKTDHRVKVSTEGSNSRAIDLLFEQVDRI